MFTNPLIHTLSSLALLIIWAVTCLLADRYAQRISYTAPPNEGDTYIEVVRGVSFTLLSYGLAATVIYFWLGGCFFFSWAIVGPWVHFGLTGGPMIRHQRRKKREQELEIDRYINGEI